MDTNLKRSWSRVAASALVVLAGLGPPLRAQAPANPSHSPELAAGQRARIDAIFADYAKPHVPGCALGVMRNGRFQYARGYGFADLERHVPITSATLFDIGSTSKQFAAASIALLVADGRLSFHDDVRKYLPELPTFGEPITLDHLMRHTSGLRDYNGLLALAGHNLEEVTTDSQALALIVHQRKLNFPTGTRFEYSNTGYFLLSVVVQRVTGMSLADFARQRIFLPLGMTHTRYRNHFAMLIPGRALGYAAADSGGFKNNMSNWEETGDGAVHLSVDDAIKWDENFYHPRVGGSKMVAALTERGTLDNGDSIGYARGLFIDRYRGARRVQHGGAWIGYRAQLARFPDQHTSIIVLCNSDGADPETLADRVADVVLARSLTEPRHTVAAATPGHGAPVASLAHDRVTGSYYDSTTRAVIRVVDTAGALRLNYASQSFALTPTDSSTFALAGVPATVEFAMGGGDREVRVLRLRAGSDDLADGVRFTPVTPTLGELGAYAGNYYCPELDVTWPVAVENGRLVLESPKSDLADMSGQLGPAMQDRFTAGGGFLQFTRDAGGTVTGFDLSADRMRGIRFERRGRTAD